MPPTNSISSSLLIKTYIFLHQLQLKDGPFLDDSTSVVDKMLTLISTGGTLYQIAKIVMQYQPLRNAVKSIFLEDVNEQCQTLCNRSAEKSSVLRTPHIKHKASYFDQL